MSEKPQTTNYSYTALGHTFIVDPADMIMVVRPKWWQFWKKAKLVNVLDVIRDAKYETDKTMQYNLERTLFHDN